MNEEEALDERTLRGLFEARHGAADAELGALLQQVIAGARARHPEIAVAPLGFARHLVDKLSGSASGPASQALVDALSALHAPELYVAYAAAAGDRAALAAFDAAFAPELRLVLARARGPRIDADDFRQACLEKLFARDRPKLLEYSGQGDLRGFLRVTLLRLLIDLGRKRVEAPIDEPERPLDLPAPGDDPELEYLKRLYRGEFQRAFEEAAAALSAEDRNVLRYHFARGLSIDEIGALYNVHRATAARRVARARDELLAGTRRRLMERLAMKREELESVMRLIESDLHVSVHRLLGDGSSASVAR